MAGRRNSLSLVLIKADPPGKKITSFLRLIASDHSKVFVGALPGSLAPGNLNLLIKLQMPDMTNIEVIDGEKDLSGYIKVLERKGKYRKGQVMEVFCPPEQAKSIADDIRSGRLEYDPTVISISQQPVPVDDMQAILDAVQSRNDGLLRTLLDARLFSNADGIESYAAALFSPKYTANIGVNIAGSSQKMESAVQQTVDMSWMRHAHDILDVLLDEKGSGKDYEGLWQDFKSFVDAHVSKFPQMGKLDRIPEIPKDRRQDLYAPGNDQSTRTWIHSTFHKLVRDDLHDRAAGYGQSRTWTDDYDNLKAHIDNSSVEEVSESLVREFLVDIAPTRELGIHMLHDLLASELQSKGASIHDLQYLGSGRNGSAYRSPDGVVLKVTTDPLEVKSAMALVGKACEYLYLVHSVSQLSERVWLIEQEGDLKDLPGDYSEELDLAVEIIEVVGGSMALKDGDWPGVIECLSNSTEPEMIPDVLEIAEKFGIEGMCREVREHGLSMDLHSGNVKLRSGVPVLLDLGTPGDPTNEATGLNAGPTGGSVSLRGTSSSAWSGGSMVLADYEKHVPEDDGEREGNDWSFYGQGVGNRVP